MSKTGVGEKARALALKECGWIREGLSASEQPHEAVHAARKAVRRLRALLALLESAPLELDRADRTLQRLGDSLSKLRDAHVVAEAAQQLQDDQPEVEWQSVAAQMRSRSDRIMRNVMQDDPGFARRHRMLDQVYAHLDAQPWDDVKPGQLKSGLSRSERRARKAAKRADHQGDPESIHRWRRRVRRLRMQLEALPELGIKAGSVAGTSHSGTTKALHKLSDRLGWQQDFRMLRNLVRPMRVWDGKPAVLELLDAQIDKHAVEAAAHA